MISKKKLKKLIAGALTGAFLLAGPAYAVFDVAPVAYAAKGGAKAPMMKAPKAAPSAPKTNAPAGAKDRPNTKPYTPSKKAADLPKNAPNAGAAAGAANAAKSTGWGNTLRNVGLLAGGMMLGGMLASLFGGSATGLLGSILGVLSNIVLFAALFMGARWAWNKFRGKNQSAPAMRHVTPTPMNPARAEAPKGPLAYRTDAGAAMPQAQTFGGKGLNGADSRTIANHYRSR